MDNAFELNTQLTRYHALPGVLFKKEDTKKSNE